MFCFFMWLLNMCSVCEILLSFLLVTCTPFSKDIVFKLKVVNWREKTRMKCQQSVDKLLIITFKCRKCSYSKTVEENGNELYLETS